MSSTSSDEDEEETRRIKESVNGFEIAKQLSELAGKTPATKNIQMGKSKRASNDDMDDLNVLKITPEFRKFVSTELSNYLDEILKEKKIDSEASLMPVQNEKKEGIHLLSHSKMIPDDFDENCVKVEPKRRKKKSSSSDDDESFKRFHSVAVTVESIMEGACEYVKKAEKSPLTNEGKKKKRNKSTSRDS